MKKLFLIGLAATAMLTSCNDETIELNQANAIKFDNAFVDNSTRASEVKEVSFNDFSVWAYLGQPSGTVLVNETVKKGDGKWSYDNIAYWTEGGNYWFKAVAPATSNNCSFTQNGGDLTKISFTNNGTTDLMYASTEVKNVDLSSINPVAFTFSHILSKVKFSFKNEINNANYTLQVSDIKINNAFKTADYNTTEWSNQKGELVLDFAGISDIAMNATGASKELLLIPAAGKAYSISFTVRVMAGDQLVKESELTSAIPSLTLLKGNRYNLTATIDHENITPGGLKPIEFTVHGENDWVNGDSSNLPEYPENKQ